MYLLVRALHQLKRGRRPAKLAAIDGRLASRGNG